MMNDARALHTDSLKSNSGKAKPKIFLKFVHVQSEEEDKIL